MTEELPINTQSRIADSIDRLVFKVSQHWMLVVSSILGVWVLLPWLAPVLMVIGWEGAANLIYAIYSIQCHQFPQRSYFLFGPNLMVSMDEINAVWPYASLSQLRHFVGNAEMGYKVAWSDRMVSFYSPLFVGMALISLKRWWFGLRKSTRQSSSLRGRFAFVVWILALLPLAFDGFSHMISDALGFFSGFRYTNAWLVTLTDNALTPSFYVGDGLGSFNWWMRLLTGLPAGFATIWLFFPYIEAAFLDLRHSIESRLTALDYSSSENDSVHR